MDRLFSTANYWVYGGGGVWWCSTVEGMALARCTVERLMTELGLNPCGARKDQAHHDRRPEPRVRLISSHAPVWAAGAQPALGRRPDLCVDWSGFAYVAFLTDAYARGSWAGGSHRR